MVQIERNSQKMQGIGRERDRQNVQQCGQIVSDRGPSCDEDDALGTTVELLVQQYQHPLSAYASRLLGTDDVAQDIVQDTWVALCLQIQRQSSSWVARANMPAWLHTVVRNKAINYIKMRRRLTRLDAQDAGPALEVHLLCADLPECSAQRADVCQALYQAIRALRKSQREVIVYRFFYGYSLSEIIRTLDIPLNTAKARLARGKKRLQQLLNECGVERTDLDAWALQRATGARVGGTPLIPGC
ncbi:MAG TPA: RNA polymerase sigma factor [Ktedonobacteraceae bacterium]|jgi:RNA polymerase sigma-70 factor (ECF subfamily)